MTTGGREVPAPAEFRIGRTGAGFRWEGEGWPGLPLLFLPDGRLFEPILLHFAFKAATGRARPSSMRPECYALREYLAWLHWRGLDWRGATDRTLREWRGWQKDSRAASPGAARPRPPSDTQIQRKLAAVFGFYLSAPLAMQFGPGFPGPGAFVGERGSGLPITSKEVAAVLPDGRRVARTVWADAGRATRDGVRRDAPTPALVARVLASIRGRAVSAGSARSEAAVLLAERDWLMARCAAEAGLRADEIASMSIQSLARALAGDGAWPTGRRWTDDSALPDLSKDAVRRATLLRELRSLARHGRTAIGVKVTCKGVERLAPFPIALVEDLLEIGVWTVRAAMMPAGGNGGGRPVVSEVFLSARTGQALVAGSVSDVLKGGFDAAGVLGSGHRLRAAFSVALALRLVEERLPLNRFTYDAQLERAVLLEVAQALGHARTSVTVRHYVDLALMRLFRLPNTDRLRAVLDAHRTLATRAAELGSERLELVAEVVRGLARETKRGSLEDMVRQALDAAEHG